MGTGKRHGLHGMVLYEQETGLKQIAEAACVGSNTRMADVFGIESLIRFLCASSSLN